MAEGNLRQNSWSLVIYRPVGNGDINQVRCWLKIQNQEGVDVTYDVAKASYEWVNGDRVKSYNSRPPFSSVFNPNITSPLYKYEKSYYLSGGMAMHLILKSGKYKISFYTPVEKTNLFETENPGDWISNTFEYDTQNPAKVIFLCPTANENGFYNGGWWLDYKAPKFFRFTIPLMQLQKAEINE
ncbi:MAG: hypothetical protein K5866_00570 [Treponema sp.]|nr:hypothetical protein [Treponema sp.]